MSDWFHNLPVWWMTLIVFSATYGATAIIYWIVTRLAVDQRARAFKALSPGMLPPLGIIFGLLVGFVAVQVWNEFDHATAAVVNEASALRSVVLLAASLSPEEEKELRGLVSRHIENCVDEEWRAMSEQRATLILPPAPMVEALQRVLAFAPSNDGQRTAATGNCKCPEGCAGCTSATHHRQPIKRELCQMDGSASSGPHYPDCYCHGAQRQSISLRHSAGTVLNRGCTLPLADCFVQSAIHGADIGPT
jgi:hypothetical protein